MDDFTNQIGQALASTLTTDDPPVNLISKNFGMSVAMVELSGDEPPTLDAGLSQVIPDAGQTGGVSIAMQVS